MNMRKIQAALEIVAKYVDPEKSYLQGEHDIIYMPLMNNAEISIQDEAKLKELGAFKSSEVDCWAVFT